MSPSFFERLTGSLRASDDADEPALEPKTVVARSPSRVSAKSAPGASFSTAAMMPDDREVGLPMRGGNQAADGEEGQLTVDIYDDGASIVVQSSVAGTRPDDIDISLEDNMLTIRGTRERSHEVEDDNFYYRELYWGSFSRSIILPEEVDFSKADAAIKNGLLTIKLPKKDRGAKKLKVKAGE